MSGRLAVQTDPTAINLGNGIVWGALLRTKGKGTVVQGLKQVTLGSERAPSSISYSIMFM